MRPRLMGPRPVSWLWLADFWDPIDDVAPEGLLGGWDLGMPGFQGGLG
ncbi:hypothetical protein [Streptomyces sp. NPDC056492]